PLIGYAREFHGKKIPPVSMPHQFRLHDLDLSESTDRLEYQIHDDLELRFIPEYTLRGVLEKSRTRLSRDKPEWKALSEDPIRGKIFALKPKDGKFPQVSSESLFETKLSTSGDFEIQFHPELPIFPQKFEGIIEIESPNYPQVEKTFVSF